MDRHTYFRMHNWHYKAQLELHTWRIFPEIVPLPPPGLPKINIKRDTDSSCANERGWVAMKLLVDMHFLSCMTGTCIWLSLCFPAVVEAKPRWMATEKSAIFPNEWIQISKQPNYQKEFVRRQLNYRLCVYSFQGDAVFVQGRNARGCLSCYYLPKKFFWFSFVKTTDRYPELPSCACYDVD